MLDGCGFEDTVHRIRDGMDLITFLLRIKRGKGERSFSPEGGHDQFLATGRLDRLSELDILPGNLTFLHLDWRSIDNIITYKYTQ